MTTPSPTKHVRMDGAGDEDGGESQLLSDLVNSGAKPAGSKTTNEFKGCLGGAPPPQEEPGTPSFMHTVPAGIVGGMSAGAGAVVEGVSAGAGVVGSSATSLGTLFVGFFGVFSREQEETKTTSEETSVWKDTGSEPAPTASGDGSGSLPFGLWKSPVKEDAAAPLPAKTPDAPVAPEAPTSPVDAGPESSHPNRRGSEHLTWTDVATPFPSAFRPAPGAETSPSP